MNESKMNRGLKNRHLQLISLGGVIGSGYFLGTGYVLEKAGPAAVIAYLLGGLIVLCVMLCLAELAVEKPISGSFVTYAREHISPTWACGVGWSYWATWVAYVPSEMIAAGIIMNGFIPEISQLWWAVFFGLLVTIINLFHVDKFGECESWLSLVKIVALLAFSAVAALICLGAIGSQGALGASVLLGSGGFAPNGYWAIGLTMVIILVNFQGTEIIGLAAGECEKPEESIPIAVRNVTWRIIALYIIPITLLVSILPWDRASLEESVFAAAMVQYGFTKFGALFAFVILTAAISCSNSGLYGAARALYALAKLDMAPRPFAELSRKGVPSKAILISICACWAVILLYSFDPNSAAYTYLLAVSGFTGAIAWISICWSQYRSRRRMIAQGREGELRYKTPFFPYVTIFGIWAQVVCLVVMAFTPDLREAFCAGIPLLVLPMVWYRVRARYRKAMATRVVH
ncbi:amino acid permease [Mitsuokella sp. oral taxon 131]|uniref:amino acid permease n=1 Tax=Mitsuokella sp. oral taxon 131 TaxID=1321780 RepID=UPI0003AE4458|nr:amino acid permease [Mitsuokella sp. oral taxon 131]ERL03440.1 putative lysine-specific permease [Mitsuokella sp. oral taxon 131 str. W9106]